MAAIDHVYRYARASDLQALNSGLCLRLAAELKDNSQTLFLNGDLLEPLITARCLRTVSDLVGTRFYTPPAMLARILREADPVATVSEKQIRFEGFSACCSTYIRHDMTERSFVADHLSVGTTNVDFQAEMRAALAQVGTADSLRLLIDKESIELQKPGTSIVERKVPLPVRWVKGFAEVQSHLSNMRKRFSLTSVQAQRFLRSLPRSPANHEQWAIPVAQGARLSIRPSDRGVMIKGTQRLRFFEKLAASAKKLEAWFNDQLGSSVWVLDFGNQRLSMALNSEPWRGFSGDGQLLSTVSSAEDAAIAAVKAQLNWQSEIDADRISHATGLSHVSVTRAMGILAAQGILGFDNQSDAFFHRVLPFDLSLVEKLNPRLKSAKALYEKGAVELHNGQDDDLANVHSDGVVHRVKNNSTGSTCTCPWYAKHQNTRGPCKHVLATELALNETT